MNSRSIDSHYPCLIVGGGIVGAGIFRDLSLHGIPTLLIDKKDFTSQTSQASSKMLHGGIRYLENFDFKLVFEALHEKNLWLKIAPHLCYEQRFAIPVYQDDKRPLWMIRCGLFLYDFLSSFQNTSHGIYNKEETIKHFPEIKKTKLKGSGVYSDAVVDDAKLTLEVIYDALENPHCKAENYLSFESVTKTKDVYYVTLKDELSGEKLNITCDKLIFATGPFTDNVLKKVDIFNWSPKLLPSKGSHLWIKENSLKLDGPVVLTPADGRVIFVIPQGKKILVGTTETNVEENLFDLTASQKDIDYLLENLKHYFPDSNIEEKDILSTFCGIRPLVKDDASSTKGKTAREHKVIQPDIATYVIIGGKYTTFRVMAQDIVQEVCHAYKLPFNPIKTLSPLRRNSSRLSFKEDPISINCVLDCLKNELPKTFEDLVKRRLGIDSRKHWPNDEEFSSFFKSIKSELNKFIKVEDQDIENFL